MGYSFAFNGKEDDSEVEGQQDYGFRFYDKRLGRFKSIDPLTKSYPWYTPYQFAGNTPIMFIDLDGLEPATPYRININNGPTITSYIIVNKFTQKQGKLGLSVEILFKDLGTGLTNFNSIQTIRSNYSGSCTSPYNDPCSPEDNLPFYYTNAELPIKGTAQGYDLRFGDNPERYTNQYWTGELSFVGLNSKGDYEFIATFGYGFDVDATNKVTLIDPVLTQPSGFQVQTLSDFNKVNNPSVPAPAPAPAQSGNSNQPAPLPTGNSNQTKPSTITKNLPANYPRVATPIPLESF